MDESRWRLSTICSRVARESRSVASHRRHAPPRERLAREFVGRPSPARPFSRSFSRTSARLLFSRENESRETLEIRVRRVYAKRAPGPELGAGAANTRPHLADRRGEPARTPDSSSRDRPTSPSQPTGANSRVTPVLASES